VNKYAEQSALAQAQRRRRRMCDDKARFTSEQEAQQRGQRHYRCPYCQEWHRSGALASLVARVSR
jgi:hypothetical protein